MKAFTHGTKRLNTAYAFDFLYADELAPELIRSTQFDWIGEAEISGWPSWAFSNHDAPRAISRWRGDCAPDHYAKLIAALILSLRGNIFIYQGEELGLPQADVPFEALQDPEAITNWPETLGRDGARTPMPWTSDAPHAGFSGHTPWLPVDERHCRLSVETQNNDKNSVLNFYRQAIALRRSSRALCEGDIAFTDDSDGLLIFSRSLGDETRHCVFNLSDQTRTLPQDLSLDDFASGLEVGSVNWQDRSISAYSGFIK